MNKIISLDAFKLKIIALIAMTIDHIGYFIYDDLIILRIIGRLAFVIFAYLIANSYLYTRNKLNFGLKLLLFGIVIDLVMIATNNYVISNIFITLGLGYFLIYFYNKQNYLIMFIIFLIPLIIKMDYSYYGLLLILFSNIYYNKLPILLIINAAMILLGFYYFNFSLLQLFSTFGILLLFLYNHQKGRSLKYLFYLYYPIHILVIIFIRDYILK